MAGKATTLMDDFKAFLLQGNVVDLAVAVVIGGAFGKIVESLIGDIITPGLLNPFMKGLGAENLAGLSFLGMSYGKFLVALINFVVIAAVIFTLVRVMETLKRKMKRQETLDSVDTVEEALDASVEVQKKLVASLDRLNEVLAHR
jgi:large conductance mechanosensitive channel